MINFIKIFSIYIFSLFLIITIASFLDNIFIDIYGPTVLMACTIIAFILHFLISIVIAILFSINKKVKKSLKIIMVLLPILTLTIGFIVLIIGIMSGTIIYYLTY